MKSATAGTATIYGLDISEDMAAIRQRIGVCPQHDVLWLPLTVLEHLKIYARLRGVALCVLSAQQLCTVVYGQDCRILTLNLVHNVAEENSWHAQPSC